MPLLGFSAKNILSLPAVQLASAISAYIWPIWLPSPSNLVDTCPWTAINGWRIAAPHPWSMHQDIYAQSARFCNCTCFTLLYANISKADILLCNELTTLECAHPHTLCIVHTLDNPSPEWTGAVGYVSVTAWACRWTTSLVLLLVKWISHQNAPKTPCLEWAALYCMPLFLSWLHLWLGVALWTPQHLFHIWLMLLPQF